MPSSSLGVVIVTFEAADVIRDCLESLLSSSGEVSLRIAVVDNASADGTPDVVRRWAEGGDGYVPSADLPFELRLAPRPVPLLAPGEAPPATGHSVTLIETGSNLGYAGGVNRGLSHLAAQQGIDRFWVLNPDCAVPPGTAAAFAREPAPEEGFSLMGGRIVYLESTGEIQSDGGRVNRRTGVTANINLGADPARAERPRLSEVDFVSGASFVASRRFYEAAGPMREDYFLYYEEVDWAFRRGALPLAECPGGLVYHRAGTAIGSPTLARVASPFSIYFMYRARMMFVRRFLPSSLAVARAYALAKAAQLFARGYRAEAAALARACTGRAPPRAVRERLSASVRRAIGI